MLYKDNAMTA